jgi:hypothetical protein
VTGVTSSPEDSTLVLSPSRDTYKRTLASVPVLIVAIAAFGFARNPTAALITLGVTVPAASIAMLLYFRNARIVVSDGQLSRTPITGRTRTYAAGDIAEAVLVPELSTGDGRHFPNLFLFDTDGNRAVRLNGSVWSTADMDQLVATLGLEPTVYPGPVKGKDLRSLHPNAIHFVEARPIVTGLLVSLVIVIVAAVVVALTLEP